jgi:ComF family protein
MARIAVEAVFPRKCRACGRYWSAGITPFAGSGRDPAGDDVDGGPTALFQRVAGPFICPDCRTGFEPMASPLCLRCGVMFVSRSGGDHLCGDCLQHRGQFRRARSAGAYDGALMALVHHLKYRACLVLGDPLGRLLRQTFHRYWPPDEIDWVVPVPLHPRRLRQRGFNQAQILVQAWAHRDSGNPGGLRFTSARDIMLRAKPTVPQTGLGKAERRQNIRGAFKVLDRDRVEGRRILLVDDVFTTGATADEAARELLKNGADAVDVLTVARTMPRSWS